MSNQITPNPSVPSQVVAEVKFPKFINNLGIIPTSYKDSMSYYETLTWLCKFLEEQVIPTVNENGNAVEELQTLYVELNNYVSNYLDNYNFQQEVNNKLDELVENGTLQNLLEDYVKIQKIYDTTSNMIEDFENLVTGMKIKTLGFYTLNDNGGADYIITDDNSNSDEYYISLENGLYAQLIEKNSVNIKQLGIKGDGTDETSTLQNVLNLKFNSYIFENINIVISQPINIKSNVKIIGENATITFNSDSYTSILKLDGTSTSSKVAYYTATEGLSEGIYYITISNNKYEFNVLQALPENSYLCLNPINKVVTINSLKEEFEVKSQINNSTVGTSLPATLNDRTIPLTYAENITIEGIKFINNDDSYELYAITSLNGKNIKIMNCETVECGLFYNHLTINSHTGSTLIDNYLLDGINTETLNSNIYITNNKIVGKDTSAPVIERDRYSGIYLNYTKDSNITNNKIFNCRHGISLYGGNVNGDNYVNDNMLDFILNVSVINNYIENVNGGGIWGSRLGKVDVTNNNIINCYDVGIDFEGSSNCIASNNFSSDCRNGCLSVFYDSNNITFDNNVCVNNGIYEDMRMTYVNGANVNHKNNNFKVKFTNNIFNSKVNVSICYYRASVFGVIHYENNKFINCTFNSLAVTWTPQIIIKNNHFRLNSFAKNSELTAIINVTPSNSRERYDVIIDSNIFEVQNDDQAIEPNTNQFNVADFDSISTILISGGTYNRNTSILIKNNIIMNLLHSITLNHISTADNDNGHIFVDIIDNIISGDFVNSGDEKGLMRISKNLSKQGSSDLHRILYNSHNYPNSVPVSGYWATGSKVYFDTPDGSGYTEAIYTSGGVWKKCNIIES